jgi:hypothetical protein
VFSTIYCLISAELMVAQDNGEFVSNAPFASHIQVATIVHGGYNPRATPLRGHHVDYYNDCELWRRRKPLSPIEIVHTN